MSYAFLTVAGAGTASPPGCWWPTHPVLSGPHTCIGTAVDPRRLAGCGC
jgi:hypothetical protein